MAGLFSKKVAQAVRKIPAGKVATYQQIATAAQSPFAYRAVGNVLFNQYRFDHTTLPFQSNHPLPCHRVIRKDGHLGGYAAGSAKKRKLLLEEGILIEKNKINFKLFGISDQTLQK